MNIDKNKHKKVMLNILSDISRNRELAVNLGFKGGTCCYFVYSLDRFSVDLDFDILDYENEKKEQIIKQVDEICAKYGEVKQITKSARKIKYSDEESGLKIDISDRTDLNKLNTYEVLDIVSGVPLHVLVKEDIFAHKLVALKDRFDNKKVNKVVANRDIYDINFFFLQDWDFNHEIIEMRQKMPAKKYLIKLIDFIEKQVDNKTILEGLGTLIDDGKRELIRQNLKEDVIRQLAIQVKLM